MSYLEGPEGPIVILRVVQNKQVDGEELAKLQSLLIDDLVREISMQRESVLAVKHGAFFFVSFKI
jgi:hypothetical protein